MGNLLVIRSTLLYSDTITFQPPYGGAQPVRGGPTLDNTGTPPLTLACYVENFTFPASRDEGHNIPEGIKKYNVFTLDQPTSVNVDWLGQWNGLALRVVAAPATESERAQYRTECQVIT